MIDVHRLRIFRAVVAEGSINGAATALGYTPSAVSQHITGLQRETGVVLIERVGRGIAPTDAGRALAAESTDVFDGLARLESLVSDLRSSRAGTLRICYFASAGAAWMPAVTATLGREFSDVRLELRLLELAEPDGSSPDVEIYVEGGASTSMTGYDTEPLVTEPYVAVVNRASPFAGMEAVTLRDLADEAWVDNDLSRGPCRADLLRACTAAGFTPCFHVETHDYVTAIRFVAAGVGLTVVPELATIALPAGVCTVPIAEPSPQRSISVRRHRRTTGNPAADRAVALIREQSLRTHGALTATS